MSLKHAPTPHTLKNLTFLFIGHCIEGTKSSNANTAAGWTIVGCNGPGGKLIPKANGKDLALTAGWNITGLRAFPPAPSLQSADVL